MKTVVLFEGKEIGLEEITQWEKRHSLTMARRLKKKYRVSLPETFFEKVPQMDIKEVRKTLVDAKMKLGSKAIRKELEGTLSLTDQIAGFMTVLSAHKRKSSVVEICIQDLPAHFRVEQLYADILDLMTLNSEKNTRACLAGSPDHLVLEGHGNRVQEIIEITGGSPLESRFLNYYGVEDGVNYPKDNSYPLQMVGVSKLKNGTLVGDVRHQYRSEGTGFRAKLADEFPKVFTKKMIKEHQYHLACEFLVWYEYLINKY